MLQISINKQNTELMAVGNFTSVDGQSRSQIARFDIGNVPTAVDPNVHQTLSTWSTPLYTQGCSSSFDTYLTDVEYAPNGQLLRGLHHRCVRRQRQPHRHLGLRRGRSLRGQRHGRLGCHLDRLHRR